MPDLGAALAAILPPGVALGRGGDDPLWPGEVVPKAVPARYAEFTRGRSAARAAMRALRVAPAAIPMNQDRSPLWPAGLTGSISHCEGACFAILGQTLAYGGLGLDIEPTRPLAFNLWPLILRAEEQHCADPLAVFVVKEAAYKAQYALTGVLFDFHTLSVRLSSDRFTATFQQTVGRFAAGTELTGSILRTPGHTAAICAIPAR